MTTTYAPPDTTALMVACNTWAQVADREASKARQARNQLIRDLYADGHSAASLADLLDGVSVRMVFKVINDK